MKRVINNIEKFALEIENFSLKLPKSSVDIGDFSLELTKCHGKISYIIKFFLFEIGKILF